MPQVAYVVEADMESQVGADIIQSMRMTICRMRAELIFAFGLEQNEQARHNEERM